MISKDIEAILAETKLYQMMNEDENPQPQNIVISPKVKSNNVLTYAFDENYHNRTTPVIMSEEDDDAQNRTFEEVQETLLIIKQDGIRFINDICDRLANDDENDFYINDFKQIEESEYDSMRSFLSQHDAINSDLEAVIRLFNDLLSNECFYMFPLYRVGAISFLHDAIERYQQSLRLIDDELRSRTLHKAKMSSVIKFDFDGHFKKPTDELPTMDNVNFGDYEEYPTPTADDDKSSKMRGQQIANKALRDKLRVLFDARNVACPQNQSQYEMMKQVLWPNTKYCHNVVVNDENTEYMQSIAIVKPNAVTDCLCDLIRATLIGNGYLIQNIKWIQFAPYKVETVVDAMDSCSYYTASNVREKTIHYLSSGKVVIFIIKKEIESNCTEQQCFEALSKLIGLVDPIKDRENDPDTESIRGCFGEDLVHNAIDVTLTQNNFEKIFHLFSQ